MSDAWGGSWGSSWLATWATGSQPDIPIRPTGGIPLSYEEWARRSRKEQPEDDEPKPLVIERIGPVIPPTQAPPVIRSSADLTAAIKEAQKLQTQEIRVSNRALKRRRREDEWLLLN